MAPDPSPLATPPGRLVGPTSSALRSFTLAEGIVLLVLGVLSLIFPVIASVWVTAVVAVSFLVGGIIGWINGLTRSPRLSGSIAFWRLVVARSRSWWRSPTVR
jgi:uncharacterized membrane protein HdeD (DUF308 family)